MTHATKQSASVANVVPSPPILVPLMLEALSSSESQFLQEEHDVTTHKTAFFIATAVKTANLSQELNGFLHIQRIRYSVQKSPILGLVASQINSVHTTSAYFSKTYPNIIHPFMSYSS
jgi:hypothetical protein